MVQCIQEKVKQMCPQNPQVPRKKLISFAANVLSTISEAAARCELFEPQTDMDVPDVADGAEAIRMQAEELKEEPGLEDDGQSAISTPLAAASHDPPCGTHSGSCSCESGRWGPAVDPAAGQTLLSLWLLKLFHFSTKSLNEERNQGLLQKVQRNPLLLSVCKIVCMIFYCVVLYQSNKFIVES